jgi:signal transduction histidine kinase
MLNAIAAIPKEGEITLGTRQDREGIKVFVEDNGLGIPGDILDKIFDSRFTAKPDGTGLGLSISAKILEKLGGRISVESRLAEGARFTVDLPYSFRAPGP